MGLVWTPFSFKSAGNFTRHDPQPHPRATPGPSDTRWWRRWQRVITPLYYTTPLVKGPFFEPAHQMLTPEECQENSNGGCRGYGSGGYDVSIAGGEGSSTSPTGFLVLGGCVFPGRSHGRPPETTTNRTLGWTDPLLPLGRCKPRSPLEHVNGGLRDNLANTTQVATGTLEVAG